MSRWIPILLVTTLTIAPAAWAQEHLWSQRFGNTSWESGLGIVVDGSRNVIVTGRFYGFPVDFGGGPLTNAGNYDIFVAKYDAAGNHLWSKRFGSSFDDEGYSIAVDDADNIVVTGVFAGTVNFGGGALTTCDPFVGCTNDIFVVKFDPNGNHLWSKRFGGIASDSGQSLVVDSSNNVIVTGDFGGNVNFGGGTLSSAGGSDIFVVKLDSNGNHVWSRRFGDAMGDFAWAVASDASGNVLLSGAFLGGLNFGGGSLISAGSRDLFVAKLDANGSHVWSRRAGSALWDESYGVAADAKGNVVVTGPCEGTVDFGGGAMGGSGDCDIFIAKYDANGNHLWSKRFGSSACEWGNHLAIDAHGTIIATGSFRNTVNFGGDPLTSAGNTDIFLAKFNSNGHHVWSRRFGNTAEDMGFEVAYDESSDFIATGRFRGTVNFGGNPLTSASSNPDLYIAKFDEIPTDVLSDGRDEPRILAIDAFPNPSRNGMTVVLRSASARTVRTMIVDPRGRVVRRIEAQHLDPGANVFFWDGNDDAGRRVGTGVYFAVVHPQGLVAPRKLVIAR